MSNPTWPATLPQYLEAQGFENRFPNGVVRQPMDSGPGKARRRFTAAPEHISGSIVLDRQQYAAFKAFWKDTLAMGALKFDWVHPITGEACEMSFMAEPSVSAISGTTFRATLQLIIWP